MPTEIILPKVDMVMESGTFVEWLKKEGETVRKGDPLFVIMTDKSAIECESPASGTLVGVCAKPDDVIPVTSVIGHILAPGEVLTPQAPADRGPAVVDVASKDKIEVPTVAESATTTIARMLPGEHELLRATPLARRLARELGVDLIKVKGCGPQGRIYKSDVLTAAEAPRPAAAAIPGACPTDVQAKRQEAGVGAVVQADTNPRPANAMSIRLPDAGVRDRVPLKGIRAITAQRLAYSASNSPHIYLGLNVDMTEVLRWREKVTPEPAAVGRTRPSLTAIISFVVAHLLPEHPYLNSSLSDNEIVLWKDVHLGIATALEDNLIVPVVRGAQCLSLEETAKEMSRLLEAAREKKLKPAEMSGSTFTISNLGMFGIEDFTAILNPPEAAILGVGKMIETPVVLDGQVVVRPMLHLSVGTDHRINDGLRTARFLNDLKNVLENPYLLL